MLIWLSLIFTLLFACFVWRSPERGLAFLLALLPTYLIRFKIFNLPTTLLELLILTFIIVTVSFQIWKNEFSFKKLWTSAAPFNIWAAVLLIASAIAIFVAPDLKGGVGIWKAYFLEPIALFFLMSPMLRNPETRRRAVLGLAAAVIIISVFAIYQKFTGAFIFTESWRAEATRRPTSVYGYPNALALFTAPLLPLFILFFFKQRRFSLLERIKSWFTRKNPRRRAIIDQGVLTLAALTGLTAIFFAKTSGAILALTVSAAFVGLMIRRARIWTIAIAIIFIIVIFVTPWRARFVEQYTLFGFSGGLRLSQWSETQAMLRDHPFFGAGLNAYRTVIIPYHKRPMEIFQYPHNEFLNFWSETGFMGLIAYVAILFIISRYAFTYHQTGNMEMLAAAAAFVVLVVHGFVDVPYFKNDLAVEFWFLTAFLAGIENKQRT